MSTKAKPPDTLEKTAKLYYEDLPIKKRRISGETRMAVSEQAIRRLVRAGARIHG